MRNKELVKWNGAGSISKARSSETTHIHTSAQYRRVWALKQVVREEHATENCGNYEADSSEFLVLALCGISLGFSDLDGWRCVIGLQYEFLQSARTV